MKTMTDQMAYESYSKQHYTEMARKSADERLLHRISIKPRSSKKKEAYVPFLRTRLAYVLAITFIAAMTISRVVVAMTGAGGSGGGGFLVK